MHRRTIPIAALGMALTAAFAAAPAQAGKHTTRNVLLGVTAAIGAAAVVSAIASSARGGHRRDAGRIGFRDRALQVCMRAADRGNARRGGDGVEFLRLNKVKKKSYGLKLYIALRSYEAWGRERRVVKCKVRRDLRLKSLVWLN